MKRPKRLTYDWGEHWYSSSGSKKCETCGKQFDLPVIHVASVVTDNSEVTFAVKKAVKEYGEAYKKLARE